MLGPGRYLLGIAELLVLIGFALLGAWSLRRRFLLRLTGGAGFLATLVLALALLIWPAEALGTVGAWKPGLYIALVVLIGVGLWASCGRVARGEGGEDDRARNPLPPATGPARPEPLIPTLIALAIALLAVIHFASGVKSHLSTGMTGFDSTWYHAPFAAGFFQSGDTWSLHFIAPQFLAWFYPANGEIFPAAGMLAFGRDVLSPFLNLGWFLACLFACWCIGRPCRVAPWSLALGAIALSVPALADQAGEARNDIVGIFFLLAAVALALNAWAASSEGRRGDAREAAPGPAVGLTTPELALIGLAAGLAAGAKLNFLLPAAVLVLGLVALAPRGRRSRTLLAGGLGALAGGGYWYLRNLAHAGNPLPWVHHLGPFSLPAPEQALGGREAHSVLGYLGDGSVWSEWLLPGLHHALWILWPILVAAAIAGLVLAVLSCRRSFSLKFAEKEQQDLESGSPEVEGRGRRASGLTRPDAMLVVTGLVGLAAALAWLIAPTSASGPAGMPRGFESGLRYLAPALVLGLVLLPATPPLRSRLASVPRHAGARSTFPPHSDGKVERTPERGGSRWFLVGGAAVLLVAIAIGYPVQRHYLRDRYANPSFSTPGLDAAFAWARDVSGARIATTSTRQYPLFGTDLSNRVQYLGVERPHGGFEPPSTCPQWRHLLNAGHYDYVVTTRDRIEKGHPPYPEATHWTEGPGAREVLRKPPTVVFAIAGRLDPSACRRRRSPPTAPAILLPPNGSHPQLLDHRPHRPRQVDPGRPHPRGHRRRRPEENAGADARLDGPRARARDHDQGAGGAGRVHG